MSEPSPKPGLPRHPHDRSRIALWQRQTLAALLFQLGGVPFMAIAAALGHAPWAFVLVWAPLSLAFNGFVLVGLRQGYALRWRDPTLTFQQIAYATLSAVSCYAVLGPMRGPALAMECLALLFSIFALSAREVRRLTALAIGLYGLVMLVHSGLQPQRYPPGEELANFIIVLTVLPGFALLAERLSALRAKLSAQKAELERALERLDEQAGRDELTGLLNRRRAVEKLQELGAAGAPAPGFCLALADLDHFKTINDRHGHPVGDQVLRRFAAELVPLLGPGDVLARWGGEEFVLLLARPDASQAAQWLERLRQHVESLSVVLPDGHVLRFTASFGLTEHRWPEDPSETVARADAALYQAKAAGRNRVVQAPRGGPAAGFESSPGRADDAAEPPPGVRRPQYSSVA